MKKIFFSFLCVIILVVHVKAQTPRTYTSSEILLNLKKLNVLGSVLYVAAHPDDENSRLLAYMSNEKLYKTAYLSMTRGDGGQNLIGDEQGIDLGLIRTQELLAARRIDGAEQLFTRAFDFGYSKNPEEALRIWNHDKILYDVVKIIRMNRPDVVICRFPTTGEGGHGHHTASAMLAQEAFEAAADATKFPDQLKGNITTWKAKRLLWNTFNFGTGNTQKEDQFKIDAGVYNPLLGKTYGEIASLSRSQHESQGFGVPAQRGAVIEYFATIKGDAPTNELFDGVNTTWNRIGQSEIARTLDSIITLYDINSPEKSVNGLFYLNSLVEKISGEDFWKQKKLNEINQLIIACSGIYAEAISTEEKIVENDSATIIMNVFSRTKLSVTDVEVNFNQKVFSLGNIASNKSANQTKTVLFNGSHDISEPYWLSYGKSEGSFNVPDSLFTGAPQNVPIEVEFTCKIDGQLIRFRKPLQYKYTDPVKGEFYQPVVIVPKITIRPETNVLVSSNEDHVFTNVELMAFAKTGDKATKLVRKSTSAMQNFQNDLYENLSFKKNEKENQAISLINGVNFLEVVEGDKIYNQQLHTIQYDHIPHINYYTIAQVKLVIEKIKIGGKKIGYIEGAGDKVSESLSQIGYIVTTIRKEDITKSNLKQFDAVITGVRAYNTNEWLNDYYEVLMNYVKDGGVLLVQYNTSNQLGPVKAKIAPYPFNITRNRVTDENAKMNILVPDHPVFNAPNKITDLDFNGWIQERSIYHAGDVDSNYVKLLSSKDPSEVENDGSLIVANYGKGRFIYTGISFFRQLPAGVTGAYKLFANLLTNKFVVIKRY
ncbi:MAG: PIG-L family deacetylase [Bacteroidota bacterium]